MERTKFEREKNGVVFTLPIGFRFRPTDEELVLHYLTRKVLSQPLPVAVIPDLDVFHLNPWDLPGELKEKRYFFCEKKMNLMSKCSKHFRTGCGHWKGCNKEQQILGNNNLVIGMKKSYVFHHSDGLKSEWGLQEFCVVASVSPPYLTKKMMVQVGDWVACRVYQRKRKWRNGYGNASVGKTNSFPSSSSGITQISCHELEDDEEEVISPHSKIKF